MKLTVSIIVIMLLSSSIYAKDYYNRTTNIKKIAWMDKGKEKIKDRLKDSSSAKFKNVYFNRGQSNIPTACGEVNSKNSFNAYSGYQKFIFAGSKFTYVESDISDFNTLWNKLCK